MNPWSRLTWRPSPSLSSAASCTSYPPRWWTLSTRPALVGPPPPVVAQPTGSNAPIDRPRDVPLCRPATIRTSTWARCAFISVYVDLHACGVESLCERADGQRHAQRHHQPAGDVQQALDRLGADPTLEPPEHPQQHGEPGDDPEADPDGEGDGRPQAGLEQTGAVRGGHHHRPAGDDGRVEQGQAGPEHEPAPLLTPLWRLHGPLRRWSVAPGGQRDAQGN